MSPQAGGIEGEKNAFFRSPVLQDWVFGGRANAIARFDAAVGRIESGDGSRVRSRNPVLKDWATENAPKQRSASR
jgi:hypothetical protein